MKPALKMRGYFTRNIVIVTDSTGAEGVGEVPGGEKITKALEDTKHLVLGTRLVDYKATLLKVRKWLDANKYFNLAGALFAFRPRREGGRKMNVQM